MNIKQKFALPLLIFGSTMVLSLAQSSDVFALSKAEFKSVLCNAVEGPGAVESCKKDADDGERTVTGVTFKLNDWKDKTKAQFRTFVEKKLGVSTVPPTPAPPASTSPIAGSDCGGVDTAIIKCSQDNSGGTENNGVWGLLLMVINIMTAGVGILAVGGIVYGAILYTTAADQAAQVKKATDIITNVVFGLIAYALMWAGLNFLVPGGVFS